MERRSGIAEETTTPVEDQVLSIGLSFSITGQPAIGHRPFIVLDREIQLPEDQAAHQAKCKVAPAEDATIDVQVDGASIGSIVFLAGELVGTFALPVLVLSPGQTIGPVFSDTADVDFADISITIQGNRGEEPGTEVGDVTAVFSRIGNVTAQFGDYNTDLVENSSAVPGTSLTDALEGLVQPADVMILVHNAETPVALVDAATIAVDFALVINAVVTLTDNRTLGQPTNPVPGQSGIVRIVQDATGGRTLTFHSDWLFEGGVDPTLSVGANDVDLLHYYTGDDSRVYAWLTSDYS